MRLSSGILLSTVLFGCTPGVSVPVVPVRAQAITCSQQAADSELAALSAQPSLPDDFRLLQPGRQRFPSSRPDAGTESWITVQYIVRPDGMVDPCTIRVLAYSDKALIDPGVEMLVESTFTKPPYAVKLQQTIWWRVAGT